MHSPEERRTPLFPFDMHAYLQHSLNKNHISLHMWLLIRRNGYNIEAQVRLCWIIDTVFYRYFGHDPAWDVEHFSIFMKLSLFKTDSIELQLKWIYFNRTFGSMARPSCQLLLYAHFRLTHVLTELNGEQEKPDHSIFIIEDGTLSQQQSTGFSIQVWCRVHNLHQSTERRL